MAAQVHWYGNAFKFMMSNPYKVNGPLWDTTITYGSYGLCCWPDATPTHIYQSKSSQSGHQPPNATYWTDLGSFTLTGTGYSMAPWWGRVNWVSDDVKVMLCTSSYTPLPNTHAYKSDVIGEVSGAQGYTAGGKSLTGKTISGPSAGVLTFDADDVTWDSSTITAARYAVIYDLSSGSQDSAQALLAYVDFDTSASSVSDDFTIQWDAAGIMRVTV